VPIDEVTYAEYRSVPAGLLRTKMDAMILPSPEGEATPEQFAKVLIPDSQQCPFLTEQHLCQIQSECGEAFLSATCATYPRVIHWINGSKEMTLALSCPEAARVVLLNEHLLAPIPPEDLRPRGNDPAAQPSLLMDSLWPIRGAVLRLIQDRSYPLWQRLFLLGILCRRLDSISRGELPTDVPAFLGNFAATVGSGALRGPMETLPNDLLRQLDAVLSLAGLCRQRAYIGPRFQECVKAFTTGIGNGPGATLESLAAHYAAAHEQYYAPFFHRHPHILENYLINMMLRRLFPFGHEQGKIHEKPNMTVEFSLLLAQFALIKGLLIGVAGFHREAFSVDHVIHTIQATSKHFDHHTEALKQMHALLIETRLDGVEGMSILARNERREQPRQELPANPRPTAPVPYENSRI
jgi:lysine-N-methylase